MAKELATERTWIFPSTHKDLKVAAAETGRTIGELIDLQSKFCAIHAEAFRVYIGRYPFKASKKKVMVLLKKAIKLH